jgi:thiamine biosynthesis lipoprotein
MVKRVKPLLGTFVSVSLDGTPESDFAITHAFSVASELEHVFSKFREDSQLNRVNNAPVGEDVVVHPVFAELLTQALEFYEASGGAFDPFGGAGFAELPIVFEDNFVRKLKPCRIDLTGIAKGFAVDKMVEALSTVSGLVNAGGDLRFFNHAERWADLRFGNQTRRLQMNTDALATTSMSEAQGNPMSATTYFLKPRAGLKMDQTVSALAITCAYADALCKVAWFAPIETARECAARFQGRLLFFDADGELTEEIQ